MTQRVVCRIIFSLIVVFSNNGFVISLENVNNNATFQVKPMWRENYENITCGYWNRRNYKPFQCKTAPCTEVECNFKCPPERRNYTLIGVYKDGISGADLQNMTKPIPSASGRGVVFINTTNITEVNIGDIHLYNLTVCSWVYIFKEGFNKRTFLEIYSKKYTYHFISLTITIRTQDSDDFAVVSVERDGLIQTKYTRQKWLIPKETWVHFTVQSSSSTVSFFINGTRHKDSQVIASGFIPLFEDSVFVIGNSFKGGSILNGVVQDARVYSYTLSNREISALLNGEETLASGVDVLPFCFCPREYPRIPFRHSGSSYCLSNTDDSKVLRLGDEVHPIQFSIDGFGDTHWLSEPGISDISITASLSHAYEIFMIDFIFHSLYPEYLYIMGDGGKIWQMFAKSCHSPSNGFPCLEYPAISRITWESNWDVVDRTNFYVTSEIAIRFKGFVTEDPSLQYYGLSELSLRAGCSCNGRSKECNMTTKPPKCSSCINSYGDMCQFCAGGYFLSPQSKGDLSCQSCQCNYAGVLNNTLLCLENDGTCMCNKTSIERESCDICDERSGHCKCKNHVQGRRCDRCKASYFNLNSGNPDGCQPCDCAIDGQNKTCDFITGECSCLPHVTGFNCSTCEFGFYANGTEEYINDGCPNRCDCNPVGTLPNTTCDKFTGKCQCKQNVTGLKCETCSSQNAYLYNVSNFVGCKSCGCDVRGTNENHTNDCDMVTGQCTCKSHVESRACDMCRRGFWDLHSDNDEGCKSCKCYEFGTGNETFCDVTTGQCKCRDHPRKELAGRQCEPFVLSFYPTFGPLSGGTLIYITGGYFNPKDFQNIFVGNNTCLLTNINSTDIVCMVSPLRDTNLSEDKRVSVKITFSGLDENVLQDLYVYKKDPVIHSVHPLATIPSGGISLTVRGANLNNVVQPYVNTSLYNKDALADTHLTKCNVVNGSLMRCETPRLTLPKEVERSVKRQDGVSPSNGNISQHFPNFRVRVDFIFDGVDVYRHSNESLPLYQNLYLYPDPVFENFSEVNRVRIFRQYKEESIKIKGSIIPELGIDHYRISVGVGVCDIYEMKNTEIVCRPPSKQPQASSLNTFNLPDVMVFVGKRSLETHIGYLQYYASFWDEPEIRYGVISACVVLVVVIVIIFSVSCARLRKKRDFDRHIKVYGEKPVDLLDAIDQELRDNIMNCLLDPDTLVLLEVIGKGHFGQVQRGIYRNKETNQTENVAVKTVKDAYVNIEEAVAFLKEATIMMEFNHPNVLSLIGVVLQDNKPLVVLPFMDYGDLKSFISDANRVINLRDLLVFSVQIAEGMSYLSSKRFVHRDLATRNCMLDKLMVVKIADFGLSRDIYQSDYYRMQADTSKALPIRWMAVESIIDGHYSTQSDVWSFGITLWELITRGSTPFPDVANHELRDYIRNGYRMAKPLHAPDSIYQLMLRCWKTNQDLRPTFPEIVQELQEIIYHHSNPTFSGYGDEDDGYF